MEESLVPSYVRVQRWPQNRVNSSQNLRQLPATIRALLPDELTFADACDLTHGGISGAKRSNQLASPGDDRDANQPKGYGTWHQAWSDGSRPHFRPLGADLTSR